ncbi:MAG: hypothetical protein Q7S27_06260 [Nanoarchaeota archaeon]|nr:hypothetical protein [Nanoarchaeota archaeon]
MNLVCFQGLDKENYPQLNALIKRGEWEKISIVKNKEADSFISGDNISSVDINSALSILELKEEIKEKLKPLLNSDFEVALSLASGSGKEHMALISALLSIPVGIRLVVYTKNGVEYIN